MTPSPRPNETAHMAACLPKGAPNGVGWDMQGGVDHLGVGWVMQGLGGSYRGGVGLCRSGVSHAGVG